MTNSNKANASSESTVSEIEEIDTSGLAFWLEGWDLGSDIIDETLLCEPESNHSTIPLFEVQCQEKWKKDC